MVSQDTTDYTFHSKTELVLVNVTVRDKNGNPVRDLKREDFTVLEDNKPQQVISFDLENTDAVLSTAATEAPLLRAAPAARRARRRTPAVATRPLKDRRLIILFFDLSSMQPDEIDRATTAAQNYVDKQMVPADLVSVVSLGEHAFGESGLHFRPGAVEEGACRLSISAQGGGFEEGSTGTTEGTAETGGSFTVDDTEYNIFNTDRRLQALRSIADKLASHRREKIADLFLQRHGPHRHRKPVATAFRDQRRGESQYGDLHHGHSRPAGAGAGRRSAECQPARDFAVLRQVGVQRVRLERHHPGDAGHSGRRHRRKAFLDSNDFGQCLPACSRTLRFTICSAITARIRRGTAASGASPCGSTVLDVKIDFRRGYYAPADFQHSTRDDRERQLDEELASDLPTTDLPVYLSAAYFRIADRKFYVPVSLVVPGSQIPFTHNNDQDHATLDVLGHCDRPGKAPGGTDPGHGEAGAEHSANWCSARMCSTTAASCCRRASIT